MNYKAVLKSKLAHVALALAALSLWTTVASADVITDWNLIAVNATKTGGLNTNLASRVEAIEAIAVYDAVNAIKHSGSSYHYNTPAQGPASAEAAAAQAAHDVLISFFPNQKASLDASLASSLAKLPDSSEKSNGIVTGSAAAADIIALRSNDGSTPDAPYPAAGVNGVGQYRPTPAAFAPAINSQWGSVKPFALKEGSQFRLPAPPSVGSQAYNQALAQAKEIGSATSASRTVGQTHIAQFFKQDAELTVNEAARILADAHAASIENNALVFALVDIAVADSRIAVWDTKFTYKFWRPVTALNANPDGTVTNNYAAWTPLITTPPHPEYPSGHSATVAAGLEILTKFYGDSNSLTLHSSTKDEPSRTVTSLHQLAEENGMSRIYGGIHFSFSNVPAQDFGHKVAEHTLQHGPHELKGEQQARQESERNSN
jgi:PAP2 superfamily